MKRREFITLVGGAAAAWPLAARAQQTSSMPTIGFLGAGTPASANTWVAAFVQRLSEMGWNDGRTVAIQYRWAEGRLDRMKEIAAEFVRNRVSVIVAYGTQAALAAKQATASIPVIFTLPGDPVRNGLVANLARPTGNLTGISSQTTDLSGKRVELLRTIVTGLRRLAIMADADNPGNVEEMNEVHRTAEAVGLDVVTYEIRTTDDIEPIFAHLRGVADALYVTPDTVMSNNRVRINTFALASHLPTMYGGQEYVEAAGLVSYGADFPDMFRRAGDYVDKILRGAKPADLPVEQPTKFNLVINLITARALGIAVPPNVLATADKIIE
jgi:putative tryptophan/tyrosine transport system substrate-binding protein